MSLVDDHRASHRILAWAMVKVGQLYGLGQLPHQLSSIDGHGHKDEVVSSDFNLPIAHINVVILNRVLI